MLSGPFESYLERLNTIKQYLLIYQRKAKAEALSVFCSSSYASPFAVKCLFNRTSGLEKEHQDTSRDRSSAESSRVEQEEDRYQQLMAQSDQMTCDLRERVSLYVHTGSQLNILLLVKDVPY
jgi:hypothetical protein